MASLPQKERVLMIQEKRGAIYGVLCLGVLCISTGAIFARIADAPPLAIAAYRVGIAGLLLLPAALFSRRQEFLFLQKKDWILGVVSGAFLALHFFTWISSLEKTSVATSVVLVNTSPIWAAMIAPLLGDRISRLTFAGILLSFSGASVIGWNDLQLGGGAFYGDILAILGALFLTGYLFGGRILRRKLSLLTYITICYCSAGVFLWTAVLLTGTRFTGFSAMTWLMFPAMAVIPQILGHSSYNWALKYLSAPMVAISLLGEPVGSTLLAMIFLGEALTFTTVAGALMIMAGIVLAARGEINN